jgi:LuxR family maltose regulon positive regulatory protein
MEDSSPLILTKLNVPRISGDLIPRPHLIKKLTDGLDRKLSLVCAPAGYGKTTLISQWLADSSRPVVWLALDENDNDLGVFLGYFMAAVQSKYQIFDHATLDLLKAPQLPPLDQIITTLINELTELGESILLVLDDYHTIVDTEVHQFIKAIVAYMPPQMHLVLVSRRDFPFPLVRLRIGREISEIRVRELRFDYEETKAYLEQTTGMEIDGETVALLEKRTEGWIAALRLAAITIRNEPDYTSFALSFKGSHWDLLNYLVNEVLSKQPENVQDYLLKTSILDRFNAPLSEAVTRYSTDQCQEIIKELEQSNLFITPLDNEHVWYRYHHLFREMLNHHLKAMVLEKDIKSIQVIASTWFAANGFVAEAIKHALAAGEDKLAAQWVKDCRHDLLNREDWPTLERYLNQLPDEVVQRQPALLLAKAWVLDLRAEFEDFPSLLQQAEELLSTDVSAEAKDEVQGLFGELDALWSIILCWSDEGHKALPHALRAVEKIPGKHAFARSMAMLFLALAYQISGQAMAAAGVLSKSLTESSDLPDAIIARLLIGQIFVQMLEGNWYQAAQSLDQLLEISDSSGLLVSSVNAHWFLGRISYEWNDLEAARQHFVLVSERRYWGHYIMVHDSMLNLAMIYQIQGKRTKVKDTLADLRKFAMESKILGRMSDIDSFEARLAALQGDLQIAISWAEMAPSDIPTATNVYIELPIVTKARILISQGTNASLQEAVQLLQALLTRAESTHNQYRQIATLVNLVLAYQAQGQIDDALEALERSLRLAEPGGLIRTFVDMGPQMSRMLRQLARQGVAVHYIKRILATFPESDTRQASLYDDPAHLVREASKTILVEPLTRRESEILLQMSSRRSNKEIADNLTISILTVKKHTGNIYQKLGVKKRGEAVDKAKALGILPT